jgi:creatinine amidohydrolase
VKKVEEILWNERTREEFPTWASKGTVVIVPIASTEQHGHHLPIDTDCRTVTYVSRLAACMAEDVPILVTPLIPYGISPHHMMFGGTITLTVETAIRVLREVCQCIIAHGFERIIILSGHGGNGNTVGAAALELRHTLDRNIQAFCWWDPIPEVFARLAEGPKVGIGHSGEMETSTILAISPEAVRKDLYKLVEGITDDPSLATAEKGQQVLQAGAEALVERARQMWKSPSRKPVGIAMAQKKP